MNFLFNPVIEKPNRYQPLFFLQSNGIKKLLLKLILCKTEENMGFPVLLEKSFYVLTKVKVILSLLICKMHLNMGII